ncbi:MAG: redox-sensing transcriptional repressor Rex [Armatimonadia bacterium]
MGNEVSKAAPEPTLRRLPSYYRFLTELAHEGRALVSCTHIAHEFGLDPTQVRKDLAVTGITGKPKVGYEVPSLIEAIKQFLGWDNVTEAFLVGAGSLGTALLGYEGFKEHGLNIIAAFDVDEGKVGQKLHGKQVLPLSKLSNLAQRMHIHLGIITTPAAAAQQVADLMVDGGIKAIWNFAPASLKVPSSVIVENQQLASSLAVLSSKLADAVRREEQK